MSCSREGTAGCVPDHVELGGAGLTSGYLQVMGPEDFTRDELQDLLDRARDLAEYGLFNDTKRDLLVDLAETLDLLDALEAREELDSETATEVASGQSYPRPDSWVHALHDSPRCGSDCPMRFLGD